MPSNHLLPLTYLQVTARTEAVTGAMSAVGSERDAVVAREAEAAAELEEVFNGLLGAVRARKAAAIDTMRRMSAQKRKTLEAQQDALGLFVDSLSSSCAYVTRTLLHGSPAQVRHHRDTSVGTSAVPLDGICM